MENTVRIALCGCFGKMGKIVSEEVKKNPNMEIVAGIDRSNRKSDEFSVFRDATAINVDCDVILDFSHPSSLESLLSFAISHRIPLVLCTTGYSDNQVEKIHESSKKIPIFWSSNTSIGISVLIEISKIAKEILGKEFDIEIIEKHHNKKIDSPSGTALMIAESVSDENTEYVYDRTKSKNARKQNEIGIHSIRCGGIKGEHEIIFASEHEVLSFKHSADSREVFAKGALKAVLFIENMKPGLYNMKNLLNFKNE